jgi:trimethylamine--corrinoid protein Co-methyltransferase
MQVTASYLSAAEKRLIHAEAVDLLGRVGMRLAGSRTLPLLEEAGAAVDHTTGVVRFPPELLDRTLRLCPRDVLMAGATTDDDCQLREGERLHFAPSGCCAKTLDHRTAVRRPSSLEDLRSATAVLDQLSEIDLVWTMVTATDVSLDRRELTEYSTVLRQTSKHVTFVDCPTEVEPVVRIFEVLAGDLERFRRRPRISTLCTIASPLAVDGRILDVHVALAAHGSPVNIYSMAISGATAPVTLAGTVVQGVAEFLGTATALKVAVPDAPLIFSCGSGPLDMRSTTFAIGSLENTQIGAMAVEVGHHLGVPVNVPGLATDAKHSGVQLGYEEALKCLGVALVRPDLCSGLGLFDTSNTFFLPQLVIDNEIAGMVRRLVGEVEVSHETAAVDAIARVGVGGQFLGERETRTRIRAGEHFMPVEASRGQYDQWVAAGQTELDVAAAVAERMLAARPGDKGYLSEGQTAALAEICGTVG